MDNNEKLIMDAVELARKSGVLFEKDTPTFRRKGQEGRFRIVIITNTRPDTTGHAILDKDFSYLEGHSTQSIADYLIEEFNKLNIASKNT